MRGGLLLAAWCAWALPALAAASNDVSNDAPARPAGASSFHGPVIAIIIDDMGRDIREGRRAIGLPGPVAYSFLPYLDHTRDLAELAHRRHKEVMLHLPMQAMDGRNIGRGGLNVDMTEGELQRTVDADLAAVPYVEGVNNHMGSLATQHPGLMQWLMSDLYRRGGLFFVDSRTTDMTVAQQVAAENGVDNLRRDVFLDDDLSTPAMEAQFRLLLQMARRQGWAVAIGHPHPETLAFLEEQLPRLPALGVRLVPVIYLVRRHGDWHDTEPRHLLRVRATGAALPPGAGLP